MDGASEESVVLATTRSGECVEILGTRRVNLEGLEEHIYWDFFKSCAFDSVAKSNKNNPELEVIGKEICKKLKGIPLAAKTIGGILRINLDVNHWMSINDSKMWQLQKEEHDILPVLQLSYQYLPSHLKKCFSFCSLFPKDFKFTQFELTKFWIMHGLIGPLGKVHQLTRTRADGYFHDLLRRCFFQINKHGFNSEDNKYVIHDLMHDVCQSITKDECFCLENRYSKGYRDTRYVSVFRKELKEEKTELCKYKKLHSLKVAYTSSCSIDALTNWCSELTNIRSLSLAGCKIENLPENIGNLKHLQVLDISGTNIETLPDSFCRLYNLQYLNMDDCSNIKYFPERFNNLVSLLFLSLPLAKVHLVEHIESIFEAIQLYNLRVDLRSQKIEDLKNISKLSGFLTIIGPQNIPCKEAAEEAQLNTKPLIESLRLFWLSERGHTGDQLVRIQHHEEVLHGLCPNPDLKKLKIVDYRGRNLSPSWLKEEFLPFLTEVHFDCCRKASTISHLPRSITKLTIKGCTQLSSLQNCLEPNHLPALKHIDIFNCPNLESLPVESFGGFVLLEYLEIDYCRKLRSQNAMVLPPYLKSLNLRYCGDLEKSIPSCLQNLTSLEELSISDFKHLSLGGLQFLASLQKVNIRLCPKLEETRSQFISGKIPQELPEDYLPLKFWKRRQVGPGN